MCWDGIMGNRSTMMDHSPKHCPYAYRTFRAWKDVGSDYWDDSLFIAEDEIIEQAAHALAQARINDADERHNNPKPVRVA